MQDLKDKPVNRSFDHYLLVVILFYILMVFMYGIINYNIPPYKQWDLMHYLNMSSLNQVNTTDIEAPFCFRILGPSLSKLLGKMIGSNMQAFRFLTIFFGFCCVLLFYYFFIFMKIKPIISMVSTLMFMFNKYYFGFGIFCIYMWTSHNYIFNFLVFSFVSFVGNIMFFLYS